jgi:predicted RecB family nuclease
MDFTKLKLASNEVTEALQSILTDPTNTIVSVSKGSPLDAEDYLEGGLTIDYMISTGDFYRFVMGYTELGEWIYYNDFCCKKYNNGDLIITNNPFK